MIPRISLLIFSVFFLLIANLSCFAQSGRNSSNDSGNKQEKQADRPLRVIRKPNPKFIRSCSNFDLSAVLQVTFHSSGKITNIEIIQASDCADFDRECERVAKEIEFESAVKDGEPITVIKRLLYIRRQI